MQLGFYFDMRRCSGCKTCVISCKDKKNLKVDINYRKVSTYEEGKFPKPRIYNISMACNHCINPICVAKCPTGAIYKRNEDGVVLISEEKCIGCQTCIKACPYDAPNYVESKNKSSKCDMCIDLIIKGEKPVCVMSCNCRALDFGDLDKLEKKYGKGDNIKFVPSWKNVKPSLIISEKKN